MEGGETAAVTQIESGPVPKETTARELANACKGRGMGYLMGIFPKSFRNISTGAGNQIRGGFIMGADLDDSDSGAFRLFMFKTRNDNIDSEAQTHHGGRVDEPTADQTLVIRSYNPPKEPIIEQQKRMGGLLGSKPVQIGERNSDFRGKAGWHGEADWVQFDYQIPVDLSDYRRPGAAMHLRMAIPAKVAQDLIIATDNDPAIFDDLLREMYPDLVGSDIDTKIVPHKSEGLVIFDTRQTSVPQPKRVAFNRLIGNS